MKENKTIQHQKNAGQRQSDDIVISTDGQNHRVQASGDTAKGIAVGVVAIAGFFVGLLLS